MAVSLLVVCLAAASRVLISGMRVSGDTRARVVATNLATQALEQLRAQASDAASFPAIVPGHSVGAPTAVGGDTFTVTKDVEWVGQRASVSNCDAGGGGTQILRATAVVTWKNMSGTKPVESTTTFSPPVGAYSVNTGSIAAKVLDAGVPPNTLSFVTVSVTGPSSPAPISTGSDGCAFFAYLNPGLYTVTVTKAGYVSDQLVANTSSQTASVTAGTTVPIQLYFDQTSTITVTGFTGTSATMPAATGIKLSVSNTSLQPLGSYWFGQPSAFPYDLTPIFPYKTGYTVFAGSCTDASPVGKDTSNNPFYTGASGSVAAPNPGGSATTTVPLYPLSVSVLNNSSQAVASAVVTGTPTGTNGVCQTPSMPAYGLQSTQDGTNGTTKGLSTTAVPLGHYTLKAVSGNKNKSVNVWVRPDGTWNVNFSGAATTLISGPVVLKLP